MCGNKYNSIANFTRHIKDVHSLSRAQYKVRSSLPSLPASNFLFRPSVFNIFLDSAS